jgi:hypothetical protein
VIERSQGVSRSSLEAIKGELMKLAAQEHLFPSSEFPRMVRRAAGATCCRKMRIICSRFI